MISVVVQCVPDRGVTWDRSKASIEASDIGTAYTRLLHPQEDPPLPLGRFFIQVLQWMADAPTEWVLRLEDDALVNKHILHNLSTWPDLAAKDFGAGWCFDPSWHRGRFLGDMLHGAVGVLLPRAFIPKIIEECERDRVVDPMRLDQDLMLARAVRHAGKYIYLHDPPLVEHPIDEPSMLGHVHSLLSGTTNGCFKEEWRR